MGFGGSGSMNVVMKNNRNLLSNNKREKFKNGLGSYSIGDKPEFNCPSASPQLLRRIHERMVFENEQRTRKMTIVFISIIVILITTLTTVLS